MGGCSLARMMSQPDNPARATANSAARTPTTPAPANFPATGASNRRSWDAAVPARTALSAGSTTLRTASAPRPPADAGAEGRCCRRR